MFVLNFLKLKHNLLDTGKISPWIVACKTALGKSITWKTTMPSKKFHLTRKFVRNKLPQSTVGGDFLGRSFPVLDLLIR